MKTFRFVVFSVVNEMRFGRGGRSGHFAFWIQSCDDYIKYLFGISGTVFGHTYIRTRIEWQDGRQFESRYFQLKTIQSFSLETNINIEDMSGMA